MDLGSFLKLIARRLVLIGAALVVVGLGLGFTGGFDGFAKFFCFGGCGLALLSGVALLFMRDPT
ncbi:MAG: hypothetical protein ABL888_20825 [Pirellulaceae bacterium]